MSDQAARLWERLCSDDPAARAAARELAVQLLPLDKALALMDRAAREHHLREVDTRLSSEQKLTTAVATLLRHRATLLGLDQPQQPPDPPEDELTPPADPEAHRRELIRDARRNRKRAEAAGSHTAAANFMREERTLLGERTPAEDGDERSDDELLADTREALDELLDGVDEETAEQIRALILGVEDDEA